MTIKSSWVHKVVIDGSPSTGTFFVFDRNGSADPTDNNRSMRHRMIDLDIVMNTDGVIAGWCMTNESDGDGAVYVYDALILLRKTNG